jgi:hypothetical protein
MFVLPKIEGSVPIRSAVDPFLRAFRERVAAGLLTGRPHLRADYVVTDAGADFIRVEAATWLTALNVGLNQVEIRYLPPSTIGYRVWYWRWAAYAIALSAVLGGFGLVLLLMLDVRQYFVRHPYSMMPGLSIEQNVAVAWVMVIFWGFVWPWILIALHKRPLHGLVGRLIRDVDAGKDAQRTTAGRTSPIGF